MKRFRIQLSEWELARLRNLLALEYHQERRNILYERRRIARGQGSRIYPIEEMEKNTKKLAKLLRKLHRRLGWSDGKWFQR